jgi:hypothetical protein
MLVSPHEAPGLLRVFREGKEGVYHLTLVSRRLLVVDSVEEDGRACLSQFALLATSPFNLQASQLIAEWLIKNEDDAAAAETPFMMAHGAGFFPYTAHDLEFGALFDEAMAADSHLSAEIVARDCGGVFAGVTSLIDVGGGDGNVGGVAQPM